MQRNLKALFKNTQDITILRKTFYTISTLTSVLTILSDYSDNMIFLSVLSQSIPWFILL
jgi:hypothetical protein